MATIPNLNADSDQAINPNTQSSQAEQTPSSQAIDPAMTAGNLATDSDLSLLDEIQAIKDAIINNENFDFTTLEAPAAGQVSSDEANDKSVSSSPILLNDDSLLIEYRSDSHPPPSNASTIQSSDSNLIFESSESAFIAGSQPQTNQIQSHLSEDLVTQSQGTFDPDTNISAQVNETQFGQLVIHNDGSWEYSLNNQHVAIQALSAGSSIDEIISLKSNSGEAIELVLTIHGSNDQAVITGQKKATIDALAIHELENDYPIISGQLSVTDIDNGEARFDTSFTINGNFGSAQINALGEWNYTLNNTSDAVQGLRSGEKVLDLFSVKTLDGTKQLIQIAIEGADDKPILSGQNVVVLDLSTHINSQGSLDIHDPDFGQSAFQALANIQSSLGYGSAEIDSQGNWSFSLDTELSELNTITDGQTQIDSFDVFTLDGTAQTIYIPIQGSDSPLYAQLNAPSNNAEILSIADILSEEPANTEGLTALISQQSEGDHSEAASHASNESQPQYEAEMYMNSDTSSLSQVSSQHLNDIPMS